MKGRLKMKFEFSDEALKGIDLILKMHGSIKIPYKEKLLDWYSDSGIQLYYYHDTKKYKIFCNHFDDTKGFETLREAFDVFEFWMHPKNNVGIALKLILEEHNFDYKVVEPLLDVNKLNISNISTDKIEEIRQCEYLRDNNITCKNKYSDNSRKYCFLHYKIIEEHAKKDEEFSQITRKCTGCDEIKAINYFYLFGNCGDDVDKNDITNYRPKCKQCSIKLSIELHENKQKDALFGMKECTVCKELLKSKMFYKQDSNNLLDTCENCYDIEHGFKSKQCSKCFHIYNIELGFSCDKTKLDGKHTVCTKCRVDLNRKNIPRSICEFCSKNITNYTMNEHQKTISCRKKQNL